MNIEKVALEGKTVRLDPMELSHLDGLFAAGSDESLWLWTTTSIKSLDDMRGYVETALKERDAGTALPFVTVEKSSGLIVGSTRFGNIDRENRRAEIGWTWITPNRQRTSVNTEAKLLMLTHAFEVWKCIRVELKTDVLNEKSRNAILRLGAQQEGILRKHMITEKGRFRDTVFFSIIDTEWSEVKRRLSAKLHDQT
jgi:RimJ/RimL family protein N-acetyltransferase